ncbi:hypothetical protein JCM19992_18810 [Thermostilla marina]
MKRHRISALAIVSIGLGLLAAQRSLALATEPAAWVEQHAPTGGIVVGIEIDDVETAAALRPHDRLVVQLLEHDDADVAKLRSGLSARGLYGAISVDRLETGRLPYVANLINVVVDPKQTVSREEILRVLVPGGMALWGSETLVKPWPQELDQWTHFLHEADNNAVASDRMVGVPRSFQWVADPKWGRSHEQAASMTTTVTANGRLFAIIDEAPLASIRFPGSWKLVARDAFNGTLLWKRPLVNWIDPLRHFRSGPAHLPRRLVAVGDVVYVTLGLDQPVTAIDAATGETIRTYAGTEYTEEILYQDGVLYLLRGSSEVNRIGGGLFSRGEPNPAPYRKITVIDADTARILWEKDCTKENVLPLGLAVLGDRLYYRSTQAVVAVDATKGIELWRSGWPTPAKRMAFSGPTLVATPDIVLCADQKLGQIPPAEGEILWGVNGWNEQGFPRGAAAELRAFDADSGKQLWSVDCKEGYNSPVDVFVVGDLVWVGPKFSAYDLHTGEVAREIIVRGPRVGMAHHRCYRNKATEKYLLMGLSGVEVVDFERGWLSNNSWLRGTCQYGIMPANGLLYAPPDACACFLTVKAPGFFAAAPQRDVTPAMPLPEAPRLEKGPAYKENVREAMYDSAWPMYRARVDRGGAVDAPLPVGGKIAWKSQLAGSLTQPIVVGNRLFVAARDRYTVHALNADTGKELWRFMTAGRVDSPPTYYKDRLYFGCADGWVYCLSAESGELVWRLQVAPTDRWVCSYERLESIWPAHGSVLIQNDTLYVTAGRSSYLDGGIVLYRVDPISGKPMSRTVLYHLDPKTGEQLTTEAKFNMDGTTNDVLVGDGERVYLKYFAFDKDGKQTQEAVPHLFSITSLLDEEWFVRTYWLIGKGRPGAGWGQWADAAQQSPFGRILCFDDGKVYGYGRVEVQNGPVGHQADAYHLFRSDLPAAQQTPPSDDAQKKRVPFLKPQPDWSTFDSLVVRAMVKGNNAVAVAGPPDVGKKVPEILAYLNVREALDAFRGNRGVFLRFVSLDDGETLAEMELPAMPVFDSMSAANGRLYISLKDGSIVCVSR